ncbi:DUF887-domain-containing protein [Basidiobolus meristosporus CBS 931.73]|uniref:DUF887-domain-containing protein n=1 Tax=Basidiobolus meristosporus CBS 931.73 TaxID=1314790 RepID=A0A1Y1YWR2_9FUNG|nr:DUF887-domain-containing protein [Basidiobolus meristosporus CBS 931.73]|eukprot:ORY02399.1 DUF887-domain-containing protein [Basidiobolus meristosporus CBS 931.73]
MSEPTLEQSIQTIFREFGLEKLTFHWQVVLLSAIACQGTVYLSSVLSPIIFPKTYRSLAPSKQTSWDVHVVSMVHCIIICVLAYPLQFEPELLADKLFGYNSHAGDVYGIACGYFLWDALFHLKNLREYGIGFALHGIACFAVYLNAFRPFLMYYGSVFLMYELSTPFLNINWFMDKLGYTGSRMQLINGICLLSTFFLARIVFGFWSSYEVFVGVKAVRDQVPIYLMVLYGVANVVLNLLNIVWFVKMIQAVASRFTTKKAKSKKL